MTATESGSKARTRIAIIDATINALNKNPQASMTEIATEANVGRTTLHRYFPERSDLMEAVAEEGITRIEAATKKARLEKGTVEDALRRLCYEYIALNELLRVLFNGSDASIILWDKWSKDSECNETDRAFEALIERGHREGVIDPALNAEWITHILWSLIYSSVSYIHESNHSSHDTLELMTRTMINAIIVK